GYTQKEGDLLIFLHLLRILWSNIVLKYACGKKCCSWFSDVYVCRYRIVTWISHLPTTLLLWAMSCRADDVLF
uniref:Uncharacterized protein n=1 Tax=Ficedula albicollis TaxID=59894 RepID=A0A803V7X7_FICAL